MVDYDVAIVGGGVIGTNIARELSRFDLNEILVEKEEDFSFGVTKGTHSFIHCGYPEDGCPLHNRLVIEGNAFFDELSKQLDIPFTRVGKLYIVTDEENVKILEELKRKGEVAGIPGLEIFGREKIKKIEPNISEEVVFALYSPTTGLVSPWGMVIALAENAMQNGVRIKLGAKVKAIKSNNDKLLVKTTGGTIRTRFLINAAGFYADEVAKMIGDNDFTMSGWKMERYIMDEVVDLVNHLVRSPTTGDFVSPTKKEVSPVKGNVILGCAPTEAKDKNDTSTTREGFERVFSFAKETIPAISKKDIITSFGGICPQPIRNGSYDYIIEPSKLVPHFINVAIGGGGVGASPAVAKMVVEILLKQGLKLIEKPTFNPIRKGIPEFRELPEREKRRLIAQDSRYGHVICRCETVTEGEIVEAIKRGARTLDGIKYRTRTGMGRCHGGFCTPRIINTLARELNIPVTEITKNGDQSKLLLFKTKELLRKTILKSY